MHLNVMRASAGMTPTWAYDPDLGIEWPIDPAKVLTSEKDLKQPLLKDAEVFE